ALFFQGDAGIWASAVVTNTRLAIVAATAAVARWNTLDMNVSFKNALTTEEVLLRRRNRAELQLEDVVRRGVRGERRVEERQCPGRLDHPADQVEAIPDHRAGDAVTRHHHGGQRGPRVRRRVVRLDGSKRADELRGR